MCFKSHSTRNSKKVLIPYNTCAGEVFSPTIETMEKIVKALGVSIEKLLK